MRPLPALSLLDLEGGPRKLPRGGPLLLCFAKADCPTCQGVAPLLDTVARSAAVWVVAQDPDRGRKLRDLLDDRVVVLDDSALGASWAWGVETVPTLFAVDERGHEIGRAVGFVREEWRALVQALPLPAGAPRQEVAWALYPEHRPGCGSRTLEPGVAERLAAASAEGPLRARRIEIAPGDDPFEFLFDRGLTDGLPVIPPTPERVLRMLEGTKRQPDEIVAVVPPNLAPATVEKVAISAVMAGCRPEFLPVVLAALEAVCTDEFNVHGVLATTWFATPALIVNGPIRHRIGMNSGMNCLGQGSRANATIGRAVQLVVRNVGGGRPGEVDRSTLGHPGKFTLCFAENEERSRWEPLHVERGYPPDQSTVTAFAGSGPVGFIDQISRDARSLATSYGLALAAVGHPKLPYQSETVVIVPPEHVDTFARDGWTKAQLREQIQRTTERPLHEWVRDASCAEGVPAALAEKLGADTRLAKFRHPDQIVIVVAGGEAGKFGAYLQPWVGGPVGSTMVTRTIEE